MSTSNDITLDSEWKPTGRHNRPQSTLARDFSAALDDLFKLNGVGALEESVEQKKDTLKSQKYQLEDLDAKLRETDERLRQLEAKHDRHVQTPYTSRKQPASSLIPNDSDAEYSSGDSESPGKSSPLREAASR